MKQKHAIIRQSDPTQHSMLTKTNSIRPVMKLRAYLLHLPAHKLFVLAACGFLGLVCVFAIARCLLIPEAYLPWRFSGKSSFRDFDKWAAKLKNPTDPLSAFLLRQLSEASRTILTNYPNTTIDKTKLQIAVAEDLDKVMLGESLFSNSRFVGITVPGRFRDIAVEQSASANSPQLNR